MSIETDAVKEANKAGKLNEHNEANDANNKTKVVIEAGADKATDAVKAVKAVEAKADEANDAVKAVDKTVEATTPMSLLWWMIPMNLIGSIRSFWPMILL